MKTLTEKTNQNIQDLPIIVQLLKNAFCEEMLAYYQYIILANFVKDTVNDTKLYKDIVDDFLENAKDELDDHAFWILKRLKELDTDWVGIENPELINQVAMHKYVMPTSVNLDICVQQVAEAERGAIETYKHLIEYTENRDSVTHKKMKAILKDEENHLKEMETFIEKINKLFEKQATEQNK
jgi:bacterioferritin